MCSDSVGPQSFLPVQLLKVSFIAVLLSPGVSGRSQESSSTILRLTREQSDVCKPPFPPTRILNTWVGAFPSQAFHCSHRNQDLSFFWKCKLRLSPSSRDSRSRGFERSSGSGLAVLLVVTMWLVPLPGFPCALPWLVQLSGPSTIPALGVQLLAPRRSELGLGQVGMRTTPCYL